MSIDEFLADDEIVELETRKHRSVLYPPLILFAVGVILAILIALLLMPRADAAVVDKVAGGIVLLLTLRLGVAFVAWRGEVIALTDRRIVKVEGILNRRVTTIPYSRIRDVALSRSVAARVGRYGDVILEVGDEGRQVILSRIPRAKVFYRELATLVSGGPRLQIPNDEEEDTGPLPRVVL